MSRIATAAAVLLALTAGCGTVRAAASPASPDLNSPDLNSPDLNSPDLNSPTDTRGGGTPGPRLFGTRWVVEKLETGQVATPVPAGARAYLTFDGAGGVGGSGGCNAFGGRAAVTGHTIVFSRIITTMMACGGGRDALERAVFAVVNAPRVRYTLTGDHLTLTAPHSGLRLGAG